MKTEWEFYFRTYDFIFDREYKFQGNLSNIGEGNGDDSLNNFSVLIQISPMKMDVERLNEHRGKVYFTIPFDFEKGKEIIEVLAYQFAQRVSFEYGKFEISFGTLFGRRIPETIDEKNEVGDKVGFFEIHLEEAVGLPKFSPNRLVSLPSLMDSGLMTTFNLAKDSDNDLDKFLNFFKIIEKTCSARNKKKPIKKCLEENGALFEIYKKVFSSMPREKLKEDYVSYINAIVDARHRCAHLKGKNFGYTPDDPRIELEVRPYLQSIESIAYLIVVNQN